MQGKVALVREQGQVFAILLVKNDVVGDARLREEMLGFGVREFGVRTALLAENGKTCGPTDIVNWLRGVAAWQLPWREFSLA
jgi:hypothetical protein